MTVPHTRRDDPLEIVRHLLTTIGTRQATSLGEAQAAAYVDSRLRRAGLSVNANTFRAAAGPGFTYPLLVLLGIVAAILALWLPLLALILALYGFIFAVGDALATPLPTLARYRDSQNIVATRAREGADDPNALLPTWRVVLLAPLDSPLHTYRLHFAAGRHPLLLIARILAFTLLIGLLLLLLSGEHTFLWYSLLLPTFGLLLTLLPWPVRNQRAMLQGSAGALAGLITCVEHLGTLREVELWAVALGATTTGSSGLYDLLSRYPFPKQQTLFLSLQHIDGNQLVYAEREGLLQQYKADPQLVRLSATAAADNAAEHISIVAGSYHSAASIASSLHNRGYRALTLFTRHTSDHSHQAPMPDDEQAHDDDALLEQVVQLIVHIVRQLDLETSGERRQDERRSSQTDETYVSPTVERRQGERRSGKGSA